jgi:outer membrane protein TolC
MRDLKDWSKQLKKYSLVSFCILLNISTLVASEDYLSQTKKDLLNYSYEKSIEDSKALKNDWINPVTYSYIYSDTENYDTTKSFISISQPIFKSGGIYSAIKYANSFKNQTNTNIDIEKKELIKQTITLLFQIKKINITINKQKLLIANSSLDVQRKKEQVLNGILDTSFLDNSILELNANQNTLIDLEYEKDTLINNLSILSDKKYEELELPQLSVTNNVDYLNNNIYILQAKDEINSSYWLKNMTISSYLPTVNFTADYTKYHDTDNNPSVIDEEIQNVGFNITIPLDVKFSYKIQSSKIEYLQNKAALADKKQQEKSIFQNSIAKINSLDKKIFIAKNDIQLYDSLVTQIQEQLNVGMKTQSDLDTIQNSQKIKKLEIKSLDVDKQLEMLELYSRMKI